MLLYKDPSRNVVSGLNDKQSWLSQWLNDKESPKLSFESPSLNYYNLFQNGLSAVKVPGQITQQRLFARRVADARASPHPLHLTFVWSGVL